MRHHSPVHWVPLALALLISSVAQGQEEEIIRVAIGDIRARGLKADSRELTRAVLLQELMLLGGEVPAGGENLKLRKRCFNRPKCLTSAAERAGVDGLLRVNLRRAGSVVRLQLSFYDAATGLEVLKMRSSAKAKRFPHSASWSTDLKRGLDVLRALRARESQAVARMRGEDSEEAPAEEVTALSALPPPPLPPPLPPTPVSNAAPATDSATSQTRKDDDDLGLWKTGSWIVSGLGVATLATGGVLGAVGLSINSELMQACSADGGCPSEREGDINMLYTLGTAAPILLGAGGVAAGLGALSLGLLYAVGE